MATKTPLAHIDGYAHDCPACIADPRPADVMLDVHAKAVIALREEAANAPKVGDRYTVTQYKRDGSIDSAYETGVVRISPERAYLNSPFGAYFRLADRSRTVIGTPVFAGVVKRVAEHKKAVSP